jgi:DNA repair photolyase
MGKIYKPTGKAGEVGSWAVNLYKGCFHGCKYPCHAAKRAARFRWGPFNKPEPSKDVIANIEKAAHKYRGRSVFMCFSCDPYQPLDVKVGLTRQAIKILHDNEVAVRILTKGGERSERDFDLLSARPDLSFFGSTLTFLDNGLSIKWEPGAALPESRLAALEKAHRMGIPTWVSLEPVIDPEQTLALIKKTYKFVGLFGLGKWNYNAQAKTINWHAYVHEAIALCKKYGKEYYIKHDLEAYL